MHDAGARIHCLMGLLHSVRILTTFVYEIYWFYRIHVVAIITQYNCSPVIRPKFIINKSIIINK